MEGEVAAIGADGGEGAEAIPIGAVGGHADPGGLSGLPLWII